MDEPSGSTNRQDCRFGRRSEAKAPEGRAPWMARVTNCAAIWNEPRSGEARRVETAHRLFRFNPDRGGLLQHSPVRSPGLDLEAVRGLLDNVHACRECRSARAPCDRFRIRRCDKVRGVPQMGYRLSLTCRVMMPGHSFNSWTYMQLHVLTATICMNSTFVFSTAWLVVSESSGFAYAISQRVYCPVILLDRCLLDAPYAAGRAGSPLSEFDQLS